MGRTRESAPKSWNTRSLLRTRSGLRPLRTKRDRPVHGRALSFSPRPLRNPQLPAGEHPPAFPPGSAGPWPAPFVFPPPPPDPGAACGRAPSGVSAGRRRRGLARPRGAPHTDGPMRLLRLGLAQINPTVGDLDGNLSKIRESIDRARALGVELLAFPEMCVQGSPPEDLLLKPAFIQGCIERTRELAASTRGMTVVVGSLERDVDLYNSAAVLHDGRVVEV